MLPTQKGEHGTLYLFIINNIWPTYFCISVSNFTGGGAPLRARLGDTSQTYL
jgi:hypothetical protein